MEKLLAQIDCSKLASKDFEKVLEFFEKFSKSVIFQDNDEQESKLFEIFAKMSELRKTYTFKKRSNRQKQVLVAKKPKLDLIEIPKIPDEIWLKILNFLGSKDIFSNFALVCKKFHNLSLDSRAMKYMNLYEISNSEKYQNAMKVLKRSKNLQEVKIKNCSSKCNNFITQAFKSNPKLKSIDVKNQSHTMDWFKISMGAKRAFGKHLESLGLGSVQIEHQDDMMQTILSQKNLKTFRVSLSNTDTVKEFLKHLPNNCKKLENIFFDTITCDSLDYQYNFPSYQAAFDLFFEEMKENLKSLGFYQFYYKDHYHFNPFMANLNTYFANPTFDHILKNLGLCQNIEKLEIWDSTYITNTTLSMISKMQNLKHLMLRQLGNYATGVNALFQVMNLEKLEFLFLSGSQYLTKEFLNTISNRMPSNLTEIWVTLSPQLEIETSTLTNLKNCHKLKKLGFEESNFSGVYSDFVQEFNEEISLYFYEYQEDCWIDLNQKLMAKNYAENILKITENGQAVAASLWV